MESWLWKKQWTCRKDRLWDKINYMGPGLLSQCSDLVQAGRFRFEPRWGQRFSLLDIGPHETGTLDTGGRSRRQSDRSMALTTHSLHLASSFWLGGAYTSTPPLCLHGMLQGGFYLYVHSFRTVLRQVHRVFHDVWDSAFSFNFNFPLSSFKVTQ